MSQELSFNTLSIAMRITRFKTRLSFWRNHESIESHGSPTGKLHIAHYLACRLGDDAPREAPNPATGAREINLGLARNTIDLLAMLKEKTAGNLDEEEAKLLEAMLYELRTKFVAARSSS